MTEITRRDILEVASKLLDHGPVEAERRAHLFDLLLRCQRSGRVVGGRIAGQHAHEYEGENPDTDQEREDSQQPSKYEPPNLEIARHCLRACEEKDCSGRFRLASGRVRPEDRGTSRYIR